MAMPLLRIEDRRERCRCSFETLFRIFAFCTLMYKQKAVNLAIQDPRQEQHLALSNKLTSQEGRLFVAEVVHIGHLSDVLAISW